MIRTASDLVLNVWERKGTPVGEFWMTPKQSAWLLSMAKAEGLHHTCHWNAIDEAISADGWTVPGFEDRRCRWTAAWVARNGAAKVEVEIFKTDEEDAAAFAAMEEKFGGWF